VTTTLPSVEDIQDALSAIVDAADGRDLTDEEMAEVAAYEGQLELARARRERSEAIRAKVAEGRQIATPALHVKSPEQPGDTLEAAFTAYLRTGRENADIQELRNAQSEGTPSEGGFMVPDGFRQKIVARMKAFGGLANVVDNITTDTGNYLPWLVEGDDTGNRAEQVDEGGTFAGGADLSYSKVGLNAYSYMAGGVGGNPLRLSRELVQDAAFDIVGRVSSKLGERGARLRAQLLVSGTGVNQPQGITTGRTGVTTAANNALTYKDLLGYLHSVDPAYRDENCRWAFNDGFLQTLRGILDANGRPILKSWDDTGAENAPGGLTLLGHPVTIDQGFPNFTNNSPSINFGVFGNLTQGYIVRSVRDVELLVNPYSRMQQRQIEYSAWFRFDALQQDTNAYVALTGHS
jgi:HK97 family phage major capsid protein